MKSIHVSALGTVTALAAFVLNVASTGCAGAGSTAPLDTDEPPAAPSTQASALRLEQAERDLDVGRDVAAARSTFDTAIADPTTTPDQRDEAHLGLSRALEASGDREGSVKAVEALLAEHPTEQRFPLEEAAQARLKKLLTGSEGEPAAKPEDVHAAAPFARALAKYFPAPNTPNAADAPLEIRVAIFGGSHEVSERLGTFALDRAVREVRREACPLCDPHLSTKTTSGRTGSWVGIPRDRARIATSLAVFYYDLGSGKIPSRYDADLPLPSSEVAAVLEHGEGLIAVRERPGAPPLVLLAAPRQTQLVEVEEALAAMATIPTAPVKVALKTTRAPAEIQTVVRGSFGEFRRCYEALLTSSPTATGTIALHFAIRGDGRVESVTEKPEDGLRDGTFEACMTTVTRGLVFAATNGTGATTVTYPIVFSPGP